MEYVTLLVSSVRIDHHQWRYSPGRALASLTGFMIVNSTKCVTWFYTPWFRHQRHLVVTTRDSIGEAGKHRWEMAAEFCRQAPSVLVGFFYMPYTTWDRRLYFPSEGRRAADFITIKIHRPRPGLNPRTLGPVASTLTTTPPRAIVRIDTRTE
jgi:hypothetical protein